MAISKVIYKSSPQATGDVWMDATTATAAAADITSPKTAMLADGVMTTGTGSGGVGGLTLLGSGTYTKASGTNMTIPVSYTGTPRLVWVVAADPIPATNQGYLVGKYIVSAYDPNQLQTDNPDGFAAARYYYTDDKVYDAAYAVGNITLSASQLSVGRISGTYTWQNYAYNWYIYGEAAT